METRRQFLGHAACAAAAVVAAKVIEPEEKAPTPGELEKRAISEEDSRARYQGKFRGESREEFLSKTNGIVPELRPSKDRDKHDKFRCCTIGFSEEEQKWYGWSHRAFHGFGIGYTVKKGDSTVRDFYVGFVAESLVECRGLAIAMARAVG